MDNQLLPDTFINWVALLPIEIALVLIVFPVAIFAGLGALVVRGLFGNAISVNSSVGSSKHGAAAEIYAVVLGFIILFGFEQFHDTKNNLVNEAAILEQIKAIGASQLVENELAFHVDAYVAEILEYEWPFMEVAKSENLTSPSFERLLDSTREFSQNLSNSEAIHLNHLERELVEKRMNRLSSAPDSAVAEILFQVLTIGLILSIVTGWFVKGPSNLLHMLLSALIAGSVVMLMVLSAQLLYPYSGNISISNEPLTNILL